jgi:hypothetical protein
LDKARIEEVDALSKRDIAVNSFVCIEQNKDQYKLYINNLAFNMVRHTIVRAYHVFLVVFE